MFETRRLAPFRDRTARAVSLWGCTTVLESSKTLISLLVSLRRRFKFSEHLMLIRFRRLLFSASADIDLADNV